jgi:hypothetical protein
MADQGYRKLSPALHILAALEPPAAGPPPVEVSAGKVDVLAWPFRDPQWFQKMVLIGLISLIPIVGSINLYGWMLTAVDNLRSGRPELPPAGFYLERGWRLFVALLVYFLPFGLIAGALVAGLIVTVIQTAQSPESAAQATAASSIAVLFSGLQWLLVAVTYLLQSLVPVFALATDRHGLGRALDPRVLWATASVRPSSTVIAGLLTIAANFIAGVGIYVCCVGILVSLPYGMAMLAAVIRNLELEAH